MKITRVDEVDSTNDAAKRAFAEGAGEGAVIVAKTQTAGRGRRGRTWASPAGNLYVSMIFEPRISPAEAPPLAPAMGLAVALAIEEVAPVTAALKWPNDVQVGGRKVAGVLVESVLSRRDPAMLGALVVGIGVNVGAGLPVELAPIATTLSAEAGRNVRREDVEKALLDSMWSVYRRFLSGGFAELLPEWEERDALRGQPVSIDTGRSRVTGTGAGLTAGAALKVDTGAGGIVEVTAGEVL